MVNSGRVRVGGPVAAYEKTKGYEYRTGNPIVPYQAGSLAGQRRAPSKLPGLVSLRLENNKRDLTLSTRAKVAQALQIPISLLFFLASEQEDLRPIDEKTAGKLIQSVLTSKDKPTNATTQPGKYHG